MKKLLFVFPIVALLAAGCNSSQQASNQTPVQTSVAQNVNTTANTSTVTPVPTATLSATNIPADWYTSSEPTDGFQISYPKVWQFNNESVSNKLGNYQDSYKLQADEFALSAPTDSGWRTAIRVYQVPMAQVVNAIVANFTFPFGKPTSSSQLVTINGNQWTKLDVIYFNQPGSGLPATSPFETLLMQKGALTYEFNGDYNGSDPKYGSLDTNIFNSFIITTPQQPSADEQRLTDIRHFSSAMEAYFNDYNSVPDNLNQLVPKYLPSLPTAPQTDLGSCSIQDNQYTYTKIDNSDFTLTFCFAGATEGYSAGKHTLTMGQVK